MKVFTRNGFINNNIINTNYKLLSNTNNNNNNNNNGVYIALPTLSININDDCMIESKKVEYYTRLCDNLYNTSGVQIVNLFSTATKDDKVVDFGGQLSKSASKVVVNVYTFNDDDDGNGGGGSYVNCTSRITNPAILDNNHDVWGRIRSQVTMNTSIQELYDILYPNCNNDDDNGDYILIKVPGINNLLQELLESILLFDSVNTIQGIISKDGVLNVAKGDLSHYKASSTLQKYYSTTTNEKSQHPSWGAASSVKKLNDDIVNGTSSMFTPIKDALEQFRKGNFLIVVDNEDRENEGDLVIAAQDITPEKMAFMIKHTGGVVCVPMMESRLKELKLPQMVERNEDSLCTAYSISCDYSHGTTTGISAYDRSMTLKALSNSENTTSDFKRPGHVFPLLYTSGGVLTRVGHTEASIDLCRITGKEPCAGISEVVSLIEPEGMARRDELIELSREWGIGIICISDLVEYVVANPIKG